MRFRLVFNFNGSRLTTSPNQLSIIKTYFLGHYLSTKVKSHEGSRGARKNLLHTTADNMRKWAFGLQGRRLGWFLNLRPCTCSIAACTVDWNLSKIKISPNFSEGWRAGGYRPGELENFGHAANGPPGGAGGNSGMLFPGMPIALTSGSIFYTGNSIFRP